MATKTAGAVRVAVVAMVLAAVGAVAGCADGEGIAPDPEGLGPIMSRAEQRAVHDAWRVDMIVSSDMSNDVLAEYTYDEMNRLTRSNLTNLMKGQRYIEGRWENRFEWENDRMVKQVEYTRYRDHTLDHGFEHTTETTYTYDSGGRLLHPGTDDNRPGDRQYEYDPQGRLIQTYSYEFEGMIYRDRLEWDNRGNVVRHICPGPQMDSDIGFGIGQPLQGTYKETVFEYEYDDHPKPNFGLGDAFFWDGRFNSWPGAGTTQEQMARTLSHNNLTRCEGSGVAYRYTYNDEGLPETVQTIWIGIETVEPMTQTIHYKRVAE